MLNFSFYKTSNNNDNSTNNNVFKVFLEIPLIFCLIRTLLLIFVFKSEPPSYYV